MRDELLALGELQPLEELTGVPDREARDRRDGLPVEQDREAFGLQPVALADRTQRQGLEGFFLVFIILAEHGAALRRLVPQTITGGASPLRGVEGEQPRCQLRVAEPPADAGQLLAVDQVFSPFHADNDKNMGLSLSAGEGGKTRSKIGK